MPYSILETALALHVNNNIDSAVASTREFWRRKLGLPEEIVTDPRPLAEITAGYSVDEYGWHKVDND